MGKMLCLDSKKMLLLVANDKKKIIVWSSSIIFTCRQVAQKYTFFIHILALASV